MQGYLLYRLWEFCIALAMIGLLFVCMRGAAWWIERWRRRTDG